MRLRRVRHFQRAGLTPTLAVSYKRVSGAHLVISNRAFIERPTFDGLRAFVGTASPQQDGARISRSIQRKFTYKLNNPSSPNLSSPFE